MAHCAQAERAARAVRRVRQLHRLDVGGAQCAGGLRPAVCVQADSCLKTGERARVHRNLKKPKAISPSRRPVLRDGAWMQRWKPTRRRERRERGRAPTRPLVSPKHGRCPRHATKDSHRRASPGQQRRDKWRRANKRKRILDAKEVEVRLRPLPWRVSPLFSRRFQRGDAFAPRSRAAHGRQGSPRRRAAPPRRGGGGRRALRAGRVLHVQGAPPAEQREHAFRPKLNNLLWRSCPDPSARFRPRRHAGNTRERGVPVPGVSEEREGRRRGRRGG